MSSEMIERVARALAARRVYQGYDAETKARLIEAAMYSARNDARLAIEAMRQPTDRMAVIGCMATYSTIEDSWRAMIDAALSEEPSR
jgi:hypothetical protein